MKKYSFVADYLEEGKRVDFVLSQKYSEYGRSKWQTIIDNSDVAVNNKHVKSSYVLKLNDFVEVNIEKQKGMNKEVIEIIKKPEVLFMDDQIVVINKPAGLVVYSPNSSNQESVARIFADKINYKDNERSGIVHRLDKDTSGVMVLARTLQAKNDLQSQFKNRKVQKKYIALVEGSLKEPKAKIDLPIARSKVSPTKMTISAEGKRSLSEYKVIKKYKHCSLIEVKLFTGRTHQIRVQFAHIGHPIVGDSKYGRAKNRVNLNRQFLHASSLKFELPTVDSSKEYNFTAPLPDELQEFLKNL